MNSDAKPSAPNSAGTSTTNREDAPSSEARYLAEEGEAAKAAMRQALADLKARIGDMADVRVWTRQHPWMAMGAATAAGFAIGSGLVSAARAATAPPAASETPAAPSPAASGKGSLLGTLLTTVVEGLIQAVVASAAQPAPGSSVPEPFASDGNGRPDAEPASSGSAPSDFGP